MDRLDCETLSFHMASSMTAIITQCPHCLTSFNATSEQLQAAQGLVRCGACQKVFNALQHSTQTLARPAATRLVTRLISTTATPSREDEEQRNPDSLDPPLPPTARYLNQTGHTPEAASQENDLEQLDRDNTAVDCELSRLVQEEVRLSQGGLDLEDVTSPQRPPNTPAPASLPPHQLIQNLALPPLELPTRSPRRLWQRLLIGTLLGIPLLITLALTESTAYSSWMEALCQHLPWECTANNPTIAHTQPSPVQVTHVIIQPQRETPNQWLLNAILLNPASTSQPYPILELQLSDLNGTQKTLQLPPERYLNTALHQAKLPSGLPAQIQVILDEPGLNISNYQLSPLGEQTDSGAQLIKD